MEAIKKLAAKIERLTDNNDHTGACLALAEFLGEGRLYIKIMKHIKAIHDIEGSMPYELGQYRHTLRRQMIEAVGNIHGEEARRLIYSSF